MFTSASLPPNSPPSAPLSQNDVDAAHILLQMRQDTRKGAFIHSGMSSPASSPKHLQALPHIQYPTTPDQDTEMVLLPSICRQRESAVRSTLSKSMPVFGSVSSKEREDLRSLSTMKKVTSPNNEAQDLFRQSAMQNERHGQPEGALSSPRSFHSQQNQQELDKRALTKPENHQQFSTQQAQKAQQPVHKVTQAEFYAHAQAQSLYLAHAQAQTYGYPAHVALQEAVDIQHAVAQQHAARQQHAAAQQHAANQHARQRQRQQQQQPSPQQQTSPQQQSPQQQSLKTTRSYRQTPKEPHQQLLMNHHVRTPVDRPNNQPWPEQNSNRKPTTMASSDQAAMQNLFSIHSEGVRIHRAIVTSPQLQVARYQAVHAQQVAQNQAAHHQAAHHQAARYQAAHHQAAIQHQAAQVAALYHAARNQASQNQAAQYHQQEASQRRSPSEPITTTQPGYTDQQQQMYDQSVQHARRQLQLQCQQQHQQQQQSSPPDAARADFHLAMSQTKTIARQTREAEASYDSLAHRSPLQVRAMTVSPTPTSDTLLTPDAEDVDMLYQEYEDDAGDADAEDEGEGNNDDEEDYEDHVSASDLGSQGSDGFDGSSGSSSMDKKPAKFNKDGKAVKEKPRWTPQMRESLLNAVISFKHLDDMTSFHWSQIGKQVGRSGKACKDQWRRALLPKIQHIFDNCEQDFNSHTFPTSSQFQRSNKS